MPIKIIPTALTDMMETEFEENKTSSGIDIKCNLTVLERHCQNRSLSLCISGDIPLTSITLQMSILIIHC